MFQLTRRTAVRFVAVAAFATLGACAMMGGGSDKVTLTGANEVPANPSTATGTSTVKIAADGSVTGSITVTGMAPTMGHIHQAAPGVNGPVILPFKQDGNTFTPADGAKLTEAQMAAFRAGNLYVNVHSATYPGGEIRAQLKAPT